jgi:transcriptional regulator with XRE-family HTH domain
MKVLSAAEADLLARIRKARKARGWSLTEFEQQSQGSIKAVVLGSYERGSRALSLRKLLQICEVLEIPLDEFLPAASARTKTNRLVLDVRGLTKAQDAPGVTLQRFVNQMAQRRGDWNREVISLRTDDFALLSTVIFKDEELMLPYLINNNLLIRVK